MDRRQAMDKNPNKTFEMETAATERQATSLAVLRDLGNQLQVKAEKMRLLMRAEEGLGDGDFNPYSTPEMTPDRPKQILVVPQAEAPVKKEVKVSKLPASAARQRRRSKKSKPAATPTVDIRQYRPGYTWNRGGRMKELRIRHLARKYLYLWRGKVYGRLTPTQARLYYERRIVKKTFRAWHGMWWELRKEWRLEVRAECHHRYVECQKLFQAWKVFVQLQKVKHTKSALAYKHSNGKILRHCLDSWRQYVHDRREKSQRNKLAITHYHHNIVRHCWHKWMSAYELVLHRQHMESVALQFWAYRVQAQYWLVWQLRLSDRRDGVMKQFRAVRHHNTVTVRTCFRAWLQYWAHRRQKLQEKDYGLKIYTSGLIQRAFAVWKSALQHRLMMKERHDYITNLAHTFQKRRAFQHWKHFVVLRREKYEMLAEAENHYRTKLLYTGFSAFRLSVVQKHLKTMRNKMADQFRYKQLIRYGWLTWLASCENKEELLIVTQSHQAWKHYRLVLLQKCFTQLQIYAEWRHHRQAQYARADAHFYMTEMPKYLARIREFVWLMKRNRENMQNCVEFRRENLLARFYYQWMNAFHESKENRMNERMAILHYDGKLGRRFFMVWKKKTGDVLQDHKNMALAESHHNEALCKRYLTQWRQFIIEKKTSQQQDIEASRYQSRKIMKKCLQAWRKYTQRRKEKHRKTDRALNHYRRKLSGKMMAMWLHYVDTQRVIRARADVLYRRKCAQLVCETFHTWKENVGLQKQERQAELMADTHYVLKLTAKVFTAWHRFSAIHAYKKSETRAWVDSARQQLNDGVLQIYFTKWRAEHVQHVSTRHQYEKAVSFHGNKVKVKVMEQWKLFTKESVRKSLLQKQCVWFHNVRVTGHAFVAWKRAHEEAIQEREKSNLALWFWCLNLHKKVLLAWYEYTLHRREKKARVQAAMERRRCRLLREGVAQWLQVADDMSAMRKQFAAQQQVKNVYETYQVVLRCGLHWKNWAMKRYQSRGGRKPVQPRVVTDTSSQSKGGHSHLNVSDKGGQSTSSTPRFPVSLFNTPRDNYSQKLDNLPKCAPVQAASSLVSAGPQKAAASPVRIKPQAAVETHARHLQSRARPRQPSFLAESLKRAGLFVNTSNNEAPVPTAQVAVPDVATASQPVTTSGHRHEDIERLNLSILTTNTELSDKESMKMLTPRSATANATVPQARNPVLSERTRIESECSDIPGLPFQDLESFPDHNVNMNYLGFNGKEAFSNCNVDTSSVGNKNVSTAVIKETLDLSEVSNKLFDVSRTRNRSDTTKTGNFALMSPADFLAKKPTSASNSSTKVESLTPRSVVSVQSEVPYSGISSAVTTPRILCTDSEHAHALSETRSFRITDFNEQVTPRSITGVQTPRDQLSSLGFDAQSLQSTQSGQSRHSIQREIVVIRNRLKTFEQQKKKLRTMQKQLRQLVAWLGDISGQSDVEDEVVTSARLEVQELTADVDALKRSVDKERPQCASLVEQVKYLTAQLSV